MKMTFQRVLNKNDIYIKSRKIFFRKEEAIYPMVSLSATDANSEKNGKVFQLIIQALIRSPVGPILENLIESNKVF